MQVLQHPGGEPAHGPVAHPGEDHVAQLVEQGGTELERPVGQQQGDRQHQRLRLWILEGVHDLLEHDRNAHVGDLGQDQTGQRQQRPAAELPQEGQHAAQVVQIAAVPMDAFGGEDVAHFS